MRGGQDGLSYDTVAIGDLVNKDTDGDGILDWEEPLWGLDPTTKETTPGVPDSSVIKKLKAEQGYDVSITGGDSQDYTENLTETDKFSREFFSTIVALNQNGVMDQTTADQISTSLAKKMESSYPRKIFTISDIKIIQDDSAGAVKKYNETLDSIFEKYPVKGVVTNILQKFVIDENNIDPSALEELDPIIKQTQNIIDSVTKTNVPQSLSLLHLDFLNGMERVLENISDIGLYDSDAIVSFIGIKKYEENTTLLESSVIKLKNAIEQKLNN